MNDLNVDRASRISVMSVFGLIVSLLGAFWRAESLIVPAVLCLLLLWLNRNLYQFFGRKRSVWFALKALPWHWFYFLYSGLAFGIGLFRHQLIENSRKFEG